MLPKSRKARVILAIFVMFALALIIYFFFAKTSHRSNDFEIAQRATRQRQIEELNRDSDKDGLKDWEEIIFHTDPHNPDTDGDGTPDGEEVRLGRDPLKPNTSKDPLHPNDLMATSTPLAAMPQAATPASANLTQLLAQSLGQQLIAKRLMDPTKSLNPEAIGRNIANGLPTYTPETPLLTLRDIAVTQDNSDAAVKEWARKFDAAFAESFRNSRDNSEVEALIFFNALKDEKYDSLAQLDQYLQGYDSAVAKIERIQVPTALGQDEIDLLQNILKLRDVVSRFRNAEKDPVTALAALNPYFDLAQKLQDWNKNIQQEFSQRHITFKK